MRVIEPTGLYSTLQTAPPPQSSLSAATSTTTSSSVQVNSRKLNLNLYPTRSEFYSKESSGDIQSAAEETIHLTTPSGQILNSIFTESGTGNGNLLNANELHILNSLSKKSNCNGNYSIEVSMLSVAMEREITQLCTFSYFYFQDDKVPSNENLRFEYNNQFNEYFFQSEDEEYNLDFPYDKEHDSDDEDVSVENKNDEDYDDDNDDSIIKRPISSCSTNSNSTKSINESLMEDDGKYCLSVFPEKCRLTYTLGHLTFY